jgi:hypothetical protein
MDWKENMRTRVIIFISLFLVLTYGKSIAQAQGLSQPKSCSTNFDINTIDLNDLSIKGYVDSLGYYLSCKAAMTKNITMCNFLADNTLHKISCVDAYNKYSNFSQLFKNGQFSDESLTECLEKLGSKDACDHFAKAILTGSPGECGKMEGVSGGRMSDCLDMVSEKPRGDKAKFMKILRQGDPNLCDGLNFSETIAICKGLLTKTEDGCQLNEGVISFKNEYCKNH